MEINNKIDQISDEIDLAINFNDGNGNRTKHGLTVHYSTEVKSWIAGYGKKKMLHKSFGATAQEALQHLVEKLNTPL